MSRARALWLEARHRLKARLTPPLPCPERCDGRREVYREGPWLGDKESPDQRDLNEALGELVSAESRILHVGVGASGLAVRWAGSVRRIDGLTLLEPEARYAVALGLPGYEVAIADKYRSLPVSGPYELIVDNNLSSFSCCRSHFREMFAGYVRLLAPDGVILTHTRGLTYAARGGFGMTVEELGALAGEHGLALRRRGEVIALERPQNGMSSTG